MEDHYSSAPGVLAQFRVLMFRFETLEGIKVAPEARAAIAELTDTLRDNLDKIVHHGKRADAIVKNMLLLKRAHASAGRHK
jgi:two-component system NtrC family sensor kinase